MAFIGPVLAVPTLAQIRYLLRDLFREDVAAGSVNGTLATDGVSARTVQDTANHLSISGGHAVTDGNGVGWGDPRIVYPAQTRVAGKALLADFAEVSGFSFNSWVGWSTSATPGSYLIAYAGAFGRQTVTPYVEYGVPPSSGAALTMMSAAASLGRCALVLFETGTGMWIKRDGVWTLEFILGLDNTATLYPAFSHSHVGAAKSLDNMAVVQLSGAWTTLYGFATLNRTAFPMASPDTAAADANHEYQFTLPVSPSAGQKVELRYHVQDANNYWTAYIERNGGNTAWDFKLDSVVSGSPTNRITVTGVSNPTRIWVSTQATKHAAYTYESSLWTRRGGDISVDVGLSAQTGILTVPATGTTETRLASWPRQIAEYGTLEGI